MIVSSAVQLGMTWWQAWLTVWIGYGVAAPFIVLNARPGAMHHITFPVVARTSFGIWGSLWVSCDPSCCRIRNMLMWACRLFSTVVLWVRLQTSVEDPHSCFPSLHLVWGADCRKWPMRVRHAESHVAEHQQHP
jgi:hypothetical protein